jgi:hypothetical protein
VRRKDFEQDITLKTRIDHVLQDIRNYDAPAAKIPQVSKADELARTLKGILKVLKAQDRRRLTTDDD